MGLESNKKLFLLYILDVLKEFSDENHLLTQTEIIKLINSRYGAVIERKAVSRNIDFLIEYGYDISKETKGYYLVEREFDGSEITFLIDSVFSNKAIPSKNATELVKKLASFSSKYERKSYKHIYKIVDSSVDENKQYFYNIDLLSRAIDNKKQISFVYVSYKNEGGKIVKTAKEHIVNPYFMVNNNGKYYLVCNKDGYPNLANYKIENIENAKMLEVNAISERFIEGCENGINKESYIKEHPYMFNDEIVPVEFEIEDSKGISAIYEWFGKDTRIDKNVDGKLVARVKANKQAIILLAVQYGEYVKLVSPDDVRKKICDYIEMLKNKYC